MKLTFLCMIDFVLVSNFELFYILNAYWNSKIYKIREIA